MLANVKPAKGDTRAVGTTGTTATRHELDGSASELSKHVNHQVEITGTVEAASGAAATPKLKVSLIKMVSQKCS